MILGAGTTHFEGWISTDLPLLDITASSDWEILFNGNPIDRLLAEHVLEHLSEDQCQLALRSAYSYLKADGLFRIAVPDGYRRDIKYVAEVSPPKDGHPTLFNVESLTILLESIGFNVRPLAYFDAKENFHFVEWDQAYGLIQRSLRFDVQENFRRDNLCYTSLILDARKP